jgi:hypothetical protein
MCIIKMLHHTVQSRNAVHGSKQHSAPYLAWWREIEEFSALFTLWYAGCFLQERSPDNPSHGEKTMTTATKAPKTRKPARVTHGTCRLAATGNLTLAAALDSGDALLTLTPENGKPTNYTVQRLADGDGRTVGFRVTRLTQFIVDRKVYDIDVTPGYGWQCDCPDAEFQSRECKHVRALRAALATNGITIAAPQRQQVNHSPIEFDDP